jgi:hypothetical protein
LKRYNVQISVLVFILLNICAFAQDSLKVKKDSVSSPVILLSESRFSRINANTPDTITRNRFLWYPLKTIDDLFNYLPGYYLNYMDIGQVNQLHFNQLDHHYTALLRNGRPLNDLLDGSVDFNLLSRNEISEIEMTNGFGNFLYDYTNGISIINHQVFRFRPYSEISYWQDRYENLYFDGSYDQNIFKIFNFNFGITKNSYDGKYVNSDFDKWQGRFNFNFFPSTKFNAFLYANYAKIQRGLNGGIDPEKTILDRTNLFDITTAIVRNPDAYEIRERFDVDLGFLFAYGKNKSSFTKLQLFTSNLFRNYRDEENRPTPNGIYFKDNSHWIDYGVKVQQFFKYNLVKGFDLNSKTEIEYDKDLIESSIIPIRQSGRAFFIENINLLSKYFDVNAFAKAYKFDYYDNKFYFDFGVKPAVKVKIGKITAVSIYGMYNVSNTLPTYQQYFLNSYIYAQIPYNHRDIQKEKHSDVSSGIKLNFNHGEVSVEYYHGLTESSIANSISSNISAYQRGKWYNNGIKSSLKLRVLNFDLDVNMMNCLCDQNGYYYYPYTPKTSGNAMLAYHNNFFKNKLEIKIGVVSRFWTDYFAEYYDGFYNDFSGRLLDTTTLDYPSVKIKSNATFDFFVIGKINKAIFGLTFENLLNRLYITSGIYPYQERGGLFNVWSRFNITWYFLN